MRILPGQISIPTAKLVALVELAGWGCRSQADRWLVESVNRELDEMSAAAAARMIPHPSPPQVGEGTRQEQLNDATDQQRSSGGAAGTQPAGAGDTPP